ncbi:hypothetical protein ELS24_10220 [Achromobacter spanius]|uniref:hypothetical protein n=1 Tax=Achromobacter spanius TaxID=217203 RepID=UPI000F8F8811|nr:hypothetical protein [Achromobacter spanius]AZS78785.1 hypothetical protein ELS24_10220 [Achromobacter spanius]
MARGGARPGAGRKPGVPNRVTADIKALAQSYGAEAVEELVRILRKSENDNARIAAIKELFDRGYGKAAQAVIVSGDEEGGPVQFSVIKRVIVDPK